MTLNINMCHCKLYKVKNMLKSMNKQNKNVLCKKINRIISLLKTWFIIIVSNHKKWKMSFYAWWSKKNTHCL